MKILLDTHILLWALNREDKLPASVLDEINRPENRVYYSTVSVWEVTIKHIKNPKQMPISGYKLASYCDRSGFLRLPLRNEHVYLLPNLHLWQGSHNDPFDRILICQAKAGGMTFITHDTVLKHYHEPCVTVI